MFSKYENHILFSTKASNVYRRAAECGLALDRFVAKQQLYQFDVALVGCPMKRRHFQIFCYKVDIGSVLD